jgi:hypothetical protein
MVQIRDYVKGGVPPLTDSRRATAPSGLPGSLAATRKVAAWPLSSSRRWTGVGAAILGSTTLLAGMGRPPWQRVVQPPDPAVPWLNMGSNERALLLVEGWRLDLGGGDGSSGW